MGKMSIPVSSEYFDNITSKKANELDDSEWDHLAELDNQINFLGESSVLQPRSQINIKR